MVTNGRRCTGQPSGGQDIGVAVLERNANVGTKNEYSAVVRLLLNREAEIETKDGDGWTAVHQAAEWEREEVVRLLLERDADVEAKDKIGRTPL